mmetsp:Transcript_27849/g.42200  ORF Transcript_27849/g.42200 Transcript_27849/m.42200 type:complete len:86 (+) Transcript_27849:136-393(+)
MYIQIKFEDKGLLSNCGSSSSSRLELLKWGAKIDTTDESQQWPQASAVPKTGKGQQLRPAFSDLLGEGLLEVAGYCGLQERDHFR